MLEKARAPRSSAPSLARHGSCKKSPRAAPLAPFRIKSGGAIRAAALIDQGYAWSAESESRIRSLLDSVGPEVISAFGTDVVGSPLHLVVDLLHQWDMFGTVHVGFVD